MTPQDFPDRRAAIANQPRQPGRPEIRPCPRLQDPLLSLRAQRPRTRSRDRRAGPQTRPRRPLGLRRLLPTTPPPMRRGHRNRTLGRRSPERAPTLNQTNQLQPPGQSELASTVFHVRPLPPKLSVVADQQPPDGAGQLLQPFTKSAGSSSSPSRVLAGRAHPQGRSPARAARAA